jgi:hypothetical protein
MGERLQVKLTRVAMTVAWIALLVAYLAVSKYAS